MATSAEMWASLVADKTQRKFFAVMLWAQNASSAPFYLKKKYGLKQAARLWYQTSHARLMEQGFQRCAFDVGLYYKYVDERIVLVTVYVDDMLIIGKPSDIDQVILNKDQRRSSLNS